MDTYMTFAGAVGECRPAVVAPGFGPACGPPRREHSVRQVDDTAFAWGLGVTYGVRCRHCGAGATVYVRHAGATPRYAECYYDA